MISPIHTATRMRPRHSRWKVSMASYGFNGKSISVVTHNFHRNVFDVRSSGGLRYHSTTDKENSSHSATK